MGLLDLIVEHTPALLARVEEIRSEMTSEKLEREGVSWTEETRTERERPSDGGRP